jgi:hypothetical protein
MRKVMSVFAHGVSFEALIEVDESMLVNLLAARAVSSAGRKSVLGGGYIKVTVSKADAQRVADSRASEKARRAALKQVIAPDPINTTGDDS